MINYIDNYKLFKSLRVFIKIDLTLRFRVVVFPLSFMSKPLTAAFITCISLIGNGDLEVEQKVCRNNHQF